MARKKSVKRGGRGRAPESVFLHSAPMHHASAARRDVGWEESMKLGTVGLISAFVFRVFFDTYLMGEVPDYNYALYHGIVFGAVVTLVWKNWPLWK